MSTVQRAPTAFYRLIRNKKTIIHRFAFSQPQIIVFSEIYHIGNLSRCTENLSNQIFKIKFNVNSAKIHEDDYRQIATNGPMLAPEILAVFANSQIFHDHQPKKAVSPSVHGKSPLENDSKKLLKRLEGNQM